MPLVSNQRSFFDQFETFELPPLDNDHREGAADQSMKSLGHGNLWSVRNESGSLSTRLFFFRILAIGWAKISHELSLFTVGHHPQKTLFYPFKIVCI